MTKLTKERNKFAHDLATAMALADTVPGFAKAYERRRPLANDIAAKVKGAELPAAAKRAIGFIRP